MVAVSVTARKAGRAPNAISQLPNVRCPVARIMDAVLRAIVIVSVGGKVHSASNVSREGCQRTTFIYKYLIPHLYTKLKKTFCLWVSLKRKRINPHTISVFINSWLRRSILFVAWYLCFRHLLLQGWLAGRGLQCRRSTSVSMSPRLFWSRTIRSRDWTMCLWSSLDRFGLFAR